MSLSSTTNRVEYTGNASVSNYSYTFRILDDDDLLVTIADASSPPVETTLTKTTDYTVSGVGESAGGSITLVNASQSWLTSGNLKTGYSLVIRRVRPLTQTTDIRNQGDFYPETHEDTFDHLVMIAQQQQNEISRSVKLPETVTSVDFSPTLPTDIAGSLSKALVTNPDGDGFEMGPSVDEISNAQAYAINAASSATTAVASASSATTSASSAASSASAASTSATSASGSASSASTSASAASTSATNAATSASAAASSASDAAASEVNAAASEVAAAGSASSASTSASGASTSATNAANSASAASTSATSAATSETNAAAAAGSAVSTHAALTETHGATGAIVGTTNTQVLTNKSFSDPISLGEQGSTPTTPPSGYGKVYFKSDGKLYQLNDAGTETEVGAGGGSSGINYVENSDSETDTSGWVTYADGASLVDGTGGSPTATFTRSTSSPLRGTASFLLTPGNLRDGASYAFSISDADKAKSLSIAFDYAVSGTITEGDYQVYIYDVTNAQLIQPAPFKIAGTSGTNYNFRGTFQTASNSNSYRLIVHQAVSTAVTLKLDNVTVGPQGVTYTSPQTDYISYPATGSWTTNTTYTGKYSQVGDKMFLIIKVATSGLPDATALTINLPPGHSIDTTKSPTDSLTPLGTAGILGASATAAYKGNVFYNSPTSVKVKFDTNAFSGSGPDNTFDVSSTAPATFGAGDYVSCQFSVPIAGWSSSAAVSQSDSSEGRVVAARYTLATQTFTNATTEVANFSTSVYDTVSAVTTGAAWRFRAPVAGKYSVTAKMQFTSYSWTAGNLMEMNLRKNGASVAVLDFKGVEVTGTNNFGFGGSTTVDLAAGDYIDITVYHNRGAASATNGNPIYNYVNVERISGSQSLTSGVTVAARYTNSSAQSVPSATVTAITGWTLDNDSHGMVNASTGVITIPTPGRYRISANLFWNGLAAGNVVQLSLKKNSTSAFSILHVYATGGSDGGVSGSDTLRLLAGETLQIEGYQNNGTAKSLFGGSFNHFSIERVGNY